MPSIDRVGFATPQPTAEDIIRRAYLTQPQLKLAKDPDGTCIASWDSNRERWCMVAGWAINGMWVALEYEILINGEHPVKQEAWQHVPNIGPTLPSGIVALAARVKAEGFPTDTATAEELWHLASGNELPAGVARDLYDMLGYVPFAGFPLQRAERVERKDA